MENTIKVTGKCRMYVKPHLIRLLINLQDISKEYSDVLEKFAVQTEQLRVALKKQDCRKSFERE